MILYAKNLAVSIYLSVSMLRSDVYYTRFLWRKVKAAIVHEQIYNNNTTQWRCSRIIMACCTWNGVLLRFLFVHKIIFFILFSSFVCYFAAFLCLCCLLSIVTCLLTYNVHTQTHRKI